MAATISTDTALYWIIFLVPFTLAHVAAALPFRRSRLVPSALIIGTMAPDFEYFARLAPNSGFGHTLPGVFVLTLPLSVLTLWMFHAFVKGPVIALLPHGVRARMKPGFQQFRFGNPVNVALILASLIVGIATHVFWDSFTHSGTWPYDHWDFLRRSVQLPVFGAVQNYKVLQHGSTAVGLVVLAVWLVRWYTTSNTPSNVRTPALTAPSILSLPLICAVAVLGAVLRSIVGVGVPTGHVALSKFTGEWVVTAIALLWWQLVAFGALTNHSKKLESRRNVNV